MIGRRKVPVTLALKTGQNSPRVQRAYGKMGYLLITVVSDLAHEIEAKCQPVHKPKSQHRMKWHRKRYLSKND